MYKTWGEIKSEIINLGFEQSNAYAENPKSCIEAVNRAMTIVAAFVRPLIGHYVIELEDTGAEQRFDIRALTAEGGEPYSSVMWTVTRSRSETRAAPRTTCWTTTTRSCCSRASLGRWTCGSSACRAG